MSEIEVLVGEELNMFPGKKKRRYYTEKEKKKAQSQASMRSRRKRETKIKIKDAAFTAYIDASLHKTKELEKQTDNLTKEDIIVFYQELRNKLKEALSELEKV